MRRRSIVPSRATVYSQEKSGGGNNNDRITGDPQRVRGAFLFHHGVHHGDGIDWWFRPHGLHGRVELRPTLVLSRPRCGLYQLDATLRRPKFADPDGQHSLASAHGSGGHSAYPLAGCVWDWADLYVVAGHRRAAFFQAG